MRHRLLLALTALLFINAASPSGSADELSWDAHRPLTWTDFRGKAAIGSFGDAASAISIRVTPRRNGKQIEYKIDALFLHDKSWCREQSDRLLSHEQLHFDIAELYARKVRRTISSLTRQGITDQKILRQRISEILNESDQLDRAYDQETVHGALTREQESWAWRIRTELALLNNFSAENWKP